MFAGRQGFRTGISASASAVMRVGCGSVLHVRLLGFAVCRKGVVIMACVLDVKEQRIRCEICGDEMAIPYGPVKWFAGVCSAFESVHADIEHAPVGVSLEDVRAGKRKEYRFVAVAAITLLERVMHPDPNAFAPTQHNLREGLRELKDRFNAIDS